MIPWYKNDSRFEPGTVADMGCFRLTLRFGKKGWALLAAFRKSDKSLSQKVKVLEIGNCSLDKAQINTEVWLLGSQN